MSSDFERKRERLLCDQLIQIIERGRKICGQRPDAGQFRLSRKCHFILRDAHAFGVSCLVAFGPGLFMDPFNVFGGWQADRCVDKLDIRKRVSLGRRRWLDTLRRRDAGGLVEIVGLPALIRSELVSGNDACHTLNHLLATCTAQDNLPFVGKAANNLEDFFLFGFDFGEADGALGFEIVAQHFGSALRHILEDFFA